MTKMLDIFVVSSSSIPYEGAIELPTFGNFNEIYSIRAEHMFRYVRIAWYMDVL